MRPLLERAHDLHEASGSTRMADEVNDPASVDRNGRWVAETFASVGVPYHEVVDFVTAMTADMSTVITSLVTRGVPLGEALSIAHGSGLVSTLLLGALSAAGVEPDPDIEFDVYSQDPEVAAGGWIHRHGELVRVLGIDVLGRVAVEVDGVLVGGGGALPEGRVPAALHAGRRRALAGR